MVHMGLPWRFAKLPTKLNQSVQNQKSAVHSQQTCLWSSPPSSFGNTTSKPGRGQTCLQRGRFSLHDYWIEDAAKVAQTDKQEK